MNVEGQLAEKFSVEAALEYMKRAKLEGRTEKEGLSDYLVTLGFTRPEEEAFLQKFRQENREFTERIMANLEQIKKIARAAQKKYAGV
jgi:hypothetical protein